MRVLLKISGEALKGGDQALSSTSLTALANLLAKLRTQSIEVALLVGGGNLFRGVAKSDELSIDRCTADQVGMLATMMNGLLIKEALAFHGIDSCVMSALPLFPVVESIHHAKARQALSAGKLLIFVGGTGNPFFTTDTAAALRASEIGADALWKATMHVDGVYDRDPKRDEKATFFPKISYEEFLKRKLGILDLTAVTLCMTNGIAIRVFKLGEEALFDHSLGTTIG